MDFESLIAFPYLKNDGSQLTLIRGILDENATSYDERS